MFGFFKTNHFMRLLIKVHSPLCFKSLFSSQRGHNPQFEMETIFLALKIYELLYQCFDLHTSHSHN